MGPSRKAQKPVKVSVPRSTRNRTRLHKSKLITDPAQSTLQLTNQLRSLGLYAAPTLGDGNCLFRALADQLWGSPNGHLTLRAEVCDWMESRKAWYEGFVDEDRSFDTHINCMRVPGTYGGHLELSAFAHLKRCNVKVIQPGYVYIIEGGGDVHPSPSVEEEPIDETGLNEREKRRLRRDRKKQEKEKEKVMEVIGQGGTVYVAYHDWEHFSSVRNLAGPHTGLPSVVERPERPGHVQDEPPPPPPPVSKGKGKAATPRVKATPKPKAKTSIVLTPATPIETIPAAQVPLPPSRSPSPSSSLSPPLSQAASSASGSTAPSSVAPLTPPDISSLAHHERSPKRSFDESQEPASRQPASTKRRRQRPSDKMDLDHGLDADENTPSLSDDSSQSGLTSLTSSSALSSPSPPTPPVEPEPEPPQKLLTRRQFKALGLPHQHTATVATAGKTRSAGRIVIPGGRRTLRSSTKVEGVDVSGEWRTNGTGRLDVRGFRELKI